MGIETLPARRFSPIHSGVNERHRRRLPGELAGPLPPPPGGPPQRLTRKAPCYTLRFVDRRLFLQVAAAAPLVAGATDEPVYRVVTAYKPAAQPGMPGPYP